VISCGFPLRPPRLRGEFPVEFPGIMLTKSQQSGLEGILFNRRGAEVAEENQHQEVLNGCIF
jgi:hypothetical protein